VFVASAAMRSRTTEIMLMNDLPGALAWMTDDDPVTVTFRAADLRRAMEMAGGGPEIMSTAQAAKVYGWSSKRWRNWAADGRVAGAWQDDDGRWRLPRDGCRQLVDELRARGQYSSKTHPADDDPPLSGVGVQVSAESFNLVTRKGSIRRGPRKTKAS
jgi:hypothetical protein